MAREIQQETEKPSELVRLVVKNTIACPSHSIFLKLLEDYENEKKYPKYSLKKVSIINGESDALKRIIMHHYSSGSIVSVYRNSYDETDNVDIYGNNCKQAKKDIMKLAQSYGIELEGVVRE